LSSAYSDEEMLKYIHYVQRCASIRPRTYWIDIPFYTVIQGAKPSFYFGYRPKDLDSIDTIEQKSWKKHQSYLNRLDRFPLDKAEYYLRIKKVYGINSIRGLAKVLDEDWSCVSRILKIVSLSEPIKIFLRENRGDPAIVRFFNLRRHLNIAQQGEERLQLARFKEYIEEFEENSFLVK